MIRTRPLLGLASLILISLHSWSDDWKQVVHYLHSTPIGITEKELLERYPDSEKQEVPDKLPQQTANQSVYIYKIQNPLFDNVVFLCKDRRLETIHAYGLGGFFSSGWEGADAIVQYAPLLYRFVIEQWGGPSYAIVETTKYNQTAKLEWTDDNSVSQLWFTPPSWILEQSGLNKNPSGILILLKSSAEKSLRQTSKSSQDSLETIRPFEESLLDVDYDTFRLKMKVTPEPSTSSLLPGGFSEIYLGMETNELQAKRKNVKADDFFNDRYTFYETLQNDLFSSINYRARMDRVVSVQISSNSHHPDQTALKQTIAAWCMEHWGEPDQYLTHTVTDYRQQTYQTDYYLWRHENANTILACSHHPTGGVRLLMLERKLPLSCCLPEGIEEQWKPVDSKILQKLNNLAESP